MTTLENRPNTALLVIDVQTGVVDGSPLRNEVVANIDSLITKARTESIPVVWVQHSDSGMTVGSDTERLGQNVLSSAKARSTSSTSCASTPCQLG